MKNKIKNKIKNTVNVYIINYGKSSAKDYSDINRYKIIKYMTDRGSGIREFSFMLNEYLKILEIKKTIETLNPDICFVKAVRYKNLDDYAFEQKI